MASFRGDKFVDHFQTLGLDWTARPHHIRSAFRDIALRCHSDKVEVAVRHNPSLLRGKTLEAVVTRSTRYLSEAQESKEFLLSYDKRRYYMTNFNTLLMDNSVEWDPQKAAFRLEQLCPGGSRSNYGAETNIGVRVIRLFRHYGWSEGFKRIVRRIYYTWGNREYYIFPIMAELGQEAHTRSMSRALSTALFASSALCLGVGIHQLHRWRRRRNQQSLLVPTNQRHNTGIQRRHTIATGRARSPHRVQRFRNAQAWSSRIRPLLPGFILERLPNGGQIQEAEPSPQSEADTESRPDLLSQSRSRNESEAESEPALPSESGSSSNEFRAQNRAHSSSERKPPSIPRAQSTFNSSSESRPPNTPRAQSESSSSEPLAKSSSSSGSSPPSEPEPPSEPKVPREHKPRPKLKPQIQPTPSRKRKSPSAPSEGQSGYVPEDAYDEEPTPTYIITVPVTEPVTEPVAEPAEKSVVAPVEVPEGPPSSRTRRRTGASAPSSTTSIRFDQGRQGVR